MNKKIIVSTIVLGLLLTTSITTATSINKIELYKDLKTVKSSSFKADFYIDDDAPQEWYNQTNYKTIQAGVENASADDIIFVYNGTYSGGIIIDKKICLIGEDKNTTLINGDENEFVIRVEANETQISGFAIGNSKEGGYGIDVKANNCLIFENIIICNFIGVVAIWQSGVTIVNNIIDSNEIGINLLFCEKNMIIFNKVYNNYQGIVLFGLDLIDNSCFNNQICLNEVKNNYRGIDLKMCKDSNIFCNAIENNDINGIYINSSQDTTICLNGIKNNGLSPDPLEEDILPAGIVLDNSDSTVTFNNIKGNKDYGMQVINSTVKAKFNYWGAILGPKLGLFGDRIKVENGQVNFFPWVPFKIRLAGAIGDWEHLEI